jgi:hypothetical protein
MLFDRATRCPTALGQTARIFEAKATDGPIRFSDCDKGPCLDHGDVEAGWNDYPLTPLVKVQPG